MESKIEMAIESKKRRTTLKPKVEKKQIKKSRKEKKNSGKHKVIDDRDEVNDDNYFTNKSNYNELKNYEKESKGIKFLDENNERQNLIQQEQPADQGLKSDDSVSQNNEQELNLSYGSISEIESSILEKSNDELILEGHELENQKIEIAKMYTD